MNVREPPERLSRADFQTGFIFPLLASPAPLRWIFQIFAWLLFFAAESLTLDGHATSSDRGNNARAGCLLRGVRYTNKTDEKAGYTIAAQRAYWGSPSFGHPANQGGHRKQRIQVVEKGMKKWEHWE